MSVTTTNCGAAGALASFRRLERMTAFEEELGRHTTRHRFQKIAGELDTNNDTNAESTSLSG
jgi:hypothetical protein